MDAETAGRLVAFVEKVGLLRRDLDHKGDVDRYAARIARIERTLDALIDLLGVENPTLAKALRTAWEQPARSLAFRNAAHRKHSGQS